MISVIVPALNEEREIGRCLESVLGESNPEPPEIVVVDGGSRDATLDVASALLSGIPSARIVSSGRGRGRQMNEGARRASGDVLFFLHSDSRVLPGALSAIGRAVAAGAQAGCFRHRFDGRGIGLRAVSMLHDFRFACTGVVYGDQGLFIRRRLFLELGGFAEDRVMEDVEFSERLLRRARPSRVPMALVTSSRKFETIGVGRAFLQVLRLIVGYEFGNRNPHSHAFFHTYR